MSYRKKPERKRQKNTIGIFIPSKSFNRVETAGSLSFAIIPNPPWDSEFPRLLSRNVDSLRGPRPEYLTLDGGLEGAG